MRTSRKIEVSIVKVLLIIGILSCFSFSCSSRKSKIETKNLIPKKELVSVITDVYLTDGLLGIQSINKMFSDLDSLSAYIQVIESHGFTKAQFDNTLKYYYIRNPKELIKIFDLALGTLTEMQSKTDFEVTIELAREGNLWPGKTNSFYPDFAEPDSSAFSMLLDKSGVYTISYNATVFPDDQSIEPCFSAYTCNSDSLNTGRRNFISSVTYFKDGQPHMYSTAIHVPANTKLQLQGNFYSCMNSGTDWIRNARFENIKVSFSPLIQ